MWTFQSHNGGSHEARQYTRPVSTAVEERSPFGRLSPVLPCKTETGDSLNAFILSGLCSGLFAAFITCAISYLSPPSQPSLSSRDIETVAAMYTSYSSEGSSHARQKFLAGLLSEEAFVRKSQIYFLSSLIQSQLKDHPNPEQMAHLIVSESVIADYDPFLVAAVIRSESMFRRHAISGAGARGLMQIMPDTGKFLAKKIKLDLNPENLNDPRTNVRLGIAYLKYLEKMFNGSRQRALIAYNWGPANLGAAIKRRSTPPLSTLHYAQKILHNHAKWRQQYLRLASNAGMAVG
jgi:soluble lytic murein transglycosylase-like protein